MTAVIDKSGGGRGSSSDSCGIMKLWLRHFKLFCVIALVAVLAVQLLLAYKSSTLDSLIASHSKRISNSGQEPYHEDGSLRKHLNHLPLSIDDEDVHSNSNPYSKADVVGGGGSPNQKNSPEEDHPLLLPPSGIEDNGKKRQVVLPSDLGFEPACETLNKDVISAIFRARSQQCKKQIIDVACAIEQGELYAEWLPSHCPSANHTFGRPLGCFRDEKTYRLLDGYYINNKAQNSPKKCMEMCLLSGFVYAGVQYGTECFCGHEPPPSEAKVSDSSCNMKCPGESKAICGGYFMVNVYETGISKFEAQTAELIPNPDESSVRIVFLLTLNGRALRQVQRLMKSLFSARHYFFIHVDSRQDYLYRELLKLESKWPNIRLTRNRYSTIWGGASLLQMLLSCMGELLTFDWKWDFVINLSESDFPIKRLDRLEDFLTANKGRNFVKSHGRETPRFVQKQGLDKTFVECDTHMWRIGDRVLPKGIQIDGGSDWVALYRNFVEYIIEGRDQDDELITGLLTIFRHTLLPAESFFHTALRNSQFCNTYIDNNLHFTNWKRKLGCKCQYKHVVDWCGCSPNDIRPDDWKRLEGTVPKQLFFARKFEPIINQEVIVQLEDWLYDTNNRNLVNLNSYWQNIYHWEDQSPRPDDALLTLATSLIRGPFAEHFQQQFAGQRKLTLEPPFVIREVTNYMDNDRYKGFLILFEATVVVHEGGQSVGHRHRFEMLAKGTQLVQTNKKSKMAQLISVLEVSSEYDQKEQRARNYAKVLGPFVDPVTVFQLRRPKGDNATMGFNVTVLWIDPAGSLAEVTDVLIDDTPNAIFHAKLSAQHPLMPGVWTVKLIYRKTPMALCKFLVTPLQFHSQRQLSEEESRAINMGRRLKYPAANDHEWDAYLMAAEERAELLRRAKQNGHKAGVELEQWIDQLVKHFYLINNHCVVRPQPPAAAAAHLKGNVDRRNEVNMDDEQREAEEVEDWLNEQMAMTFEVCGRETSWSSMAPDPKSDLEYDDNSSR